MIAVLDKGQDRARFDLGLPDGSQLVTGSAGTMLIVHETEVIGDITAPWAVDADGTRLPTSYSSVDGTTVTQTVDTAGAAFPVVADPVVRYYRNAVGILYSVWYFNRLETGALAAGGTLALKALSKVPWLRWAAGLIQVWALAAVAARSCVAVVGTVFFIPSYAAPTYHNGGYCR